MSTWRQLAEQVRRESEGRDNRDNRDVSPSQAPIGPNVPNVPLDAGRALKLWWSGLRRVHPRQPPDGFPRKRWETLWYDAEYILENFAEQAARDGWITADLFGLYPGHPHCGGIADRLRGQRSLVFTADRACWRRLGVVEKFSRGTYPPGIPPHLKPFWEAER
jgi:hypothetical protein